MLAFSGHEDSTGLFGPSLLFPSVALINYSCPLVPMKVARYEFYFACITTTSKNEL
jgi:hypothetical protein